MSDLSNLGRIYIFKEKWDRGKNIGWKKGRIKTKKEGRTE